MSIIPQEATEKEVLFGRIQKFFSKHKIGALLKKCNGTKEKGISAQHVLFDCWFANPAQITQIKSKGMDVIAMIKKSSRIKYGYGDSQFNSNWNLMIILIKNFWGLYKP